MTQPTVAAGVPLSSLYIHDLNARSEPTAEEIKLLADSIAREGLLQNLCGFTNGDDSAVGIVAGGRRLRALQLLHTNDPDVAIPVNITSDTEQARSWAGTENTARAPLHPADEIRAYGRARLAGRSDSDIAKSFAVTEVHVRRRLKLSTLPGQALDALRADQITLDVAAALTVEPDSDRILGILDTAIQRGMSAGEVRNAIASGKVAATDRRAVFVGVDRYQEAGGIVLPSLFTDDVILENADLLDELFAAKLDAEAQTWLARDAAWVKTTLEYYRSSDPDCEIPKGFRECYPPKVALPDADQAELEALEAQIYWQMDSADKDRMSELRERTIGEFDDDALPAIGVVLLVDREAKLKVHYYSKPDFIDAASSGGSDAVETVLPKAETIPQNLIEDLRAVKQAAIQMRMMEQFEHLLDLLTYQVAYVERDWNHPLAVSFTTVRITPEKAEGTTLPARLTDPSGEKENTFSPVGFDAFKALGKKHRNQVLATHLARTFKDTGLLSAAFAASLKVSPREIWTPTAAGYLGRIPVNMLDGIAAELIPDDAHFDRAEFIAKKKGEKAKFLESLFNDMSVREALGLSREQNAAIDAWLPDELRWSQIEDAA